MLSIGFTIATYRHAFFQAFMPNNIFINTVRT